MSTIATWHMVSSFLCRDTGLEVKTVSGRILSLGVAFVSTIIISTYTGGVASSLTTHASVSPISGVGDLRSGRVPPMRVGLRDGTAPAAWYAREISPMYVHLPQTDTSWATALRANQIDVFIWNGAKILYQINNGQCDMMEVRGCLQDSLWNGSASFCAMRARMCRVDTVRCTFGCDVTFGCGVFWPVAKLWCQFGC